jgi:hypothetical protein
VADQRRPTGGGRRYLQRRHVDRARTWTFADNSANRSTAAPIYAGAGSTTLRNDTFEANARSPVTTAAARHSGAMSQSTSNVLFAVSAYQNSSRRGPGERAGRKRTPRVVRL